MKKFVVIVYYPQLKYVSGDELDKSVQPGEALQAKAHSILQKHMARAAEEIRDEIVAAHDPLMPNFYPIYSN